MAWTSKRHVFTVETFSKTVESVIATQRALHAHFMLCQYDAFPDRKSILLQVKIFT